MKTTQRRENMCAWDVKMNMKQEHNSIIINILDVHLNCNKTQSIDKICKKLHTLKKYDMLNPQQQSIKNKKC